MGIWANYKKRVHDEAVILGVNAIWRNIEFFPDQGHMGWKVRTRAEWIKLMPRLPDKHVADEIFDRLVAEVTHLTEEGKVYMSIDLRRRLNAPPHLRRG